MFTYYSQNYAGIIGVGLARFHFMVTQSHNMELPYIPPVILMLHLLETPM